MSQNGILPTVCTDQFSGPFVALVHFCVKNSGGEELSLEIRVCTKGVLTETRVSDLWDQKDMLRSLAD